MEITRHFTHRLRDRLAEPQHFLQVLIGPRQIGKTTGVRQLVSSWPGPAHLATADDVSPPRADWIETQWRIAESLGPGAVLVIDEVQKIPGWSAAIKRLFDEARPKRALNVVLLGSASLTLQQGLADSLAGRYELIRADHWSLDECEEAFGWDLETFLAFGGYPGAAELIGDVRRWQAFVRDAIVEPVLLKDLLGMTPIAKPALFRQTFELSLSYPAQEVSLQKLLGQLQESGNVSTIKHYLELFEGAYLLRALQKYSGSEVRKRASSPKLVPLNTALLHAFRDPTECARSPEWRGRVLEAAVGAALARLHPHHLHWWRDGRHELDYVVDTRDELFAIEVKSGRAKRASGLTEFLKRHPKATPLVVDAAGGEVLLRRREPEGDGALARLIRAGI